ncbi:NBS-LRR type resistance protein [Cucumis melo var. makuwa]|uniref:NBS-LRR type resistance protein n=1 Tax=Cucumis melo var. makuwa TaxID=1194695 RepID=A0A5A7VFP2_CUCMM|nr:NBS-LRR type resistance protein [Cucumis melo var. makuwa]
MGDLRFHTSERDYQRTTQNSGVMVIGENDASGSKDNNFYGILDEVLHVQYPMEKSVWLFKCRWSIVHHDTDDFIEDEDEHLSHESTMSSFSSSFDETDVMFLEFIEDLDNPTRGSSSVGDNSENTSRSSRATYKSFSTSKSTATLRRHVSTNHTYWWNVMRTDTTSVIITWVVHSRSNHRPTRVLDRSSLTIIAAGQSHLYNDSTSSLDKKESRSTMWSCSSKHTAGFAMNFVHEGTSTTRPTMLDGANYGY